MKPPGSCNQRGGEGPWGGIPDRVRTLGASSGRRHSGAGWGVGGRFSFFPSAGGPAPRASLCGRRLEGYLLKGKRVQYLWITTQADLERESHPCSSLNYFHGVFLIDFLWPVILNCLVYSPYLVYGSSDSKESAYNAGDLGLIPGSGRSPGAFLGA